MLGKLRWTYGSLPGLIELFLSHGTDPNLQDCKGTTVLHIICANENTNYSEKGIYHKADRQFWETIDILSRYGGNIHIKDNHACTPVSRFCSHNIIGQNIKQDVLSRFPT